MQQDQPYLYFLFHLVSLSQLSVQLPVSGLKKKNNCLHVSLPKTSASTHKSTRTHAYAQLTPIGSQTIHIPHAYHTRLEYVPFATSSRYSSASTLSFTRLRGIEISSLMFSLLFLRLFLLLVTLLVLFLILLLLRLWCCLGGAALRPSCRLCVVTCGSLSEDSGEVSCPIFRETQSEEPGYDIIKVHCVL